MARVGEKCQQQDYSDVCGFHKTSTPISRHYDTTCLSTSIGQICMVRRRTASGIGRETVCENVSGLEWRLVSGRMMLIRACPSLIIAAVANRLTSTPVHRHAF